MSQENINSMNNSNDLILPLESAEFVMQNAKSVQLNQLSIESLAKKVINFSFFELIH